jgi:nucleoid-associated protein YgaU
MAQDTADEDRDETESTETPAPGTLWKILGFLKKIPLPSLGSERHEMLLDVNRAPAEPHAEPHPQPTHSPSRPAAKAPVLHLKRETRVGLVIVISFVVLVIALVVQKGWIGRSPSTLLAVNGPDTPEAKAKEEAEAKAKEEAEAKAKAEAEAKAKAEAEAKADKSEKDKTSPKTESEPKPVPEPTTDDKKPTTELPAVQTNESKPPEGLPKGESDPSKLPPMLPETPPNLPNLPETPSSKVVDLPAVPGNEPSLPPTPPEPKSEPNPAVMPAVAPPTPSSEPKPAVLPAVAPTTPDSIPSALPNPTDLPPTPTETKPPATEINPLPAVAQPTTPTPTGAANPPEGIPAQPPPQPTPQPPTTPVTPEPLATTTTTTTPLPSEKTPPLESIPSNPAPAPAPVEPAAATTSMGGASTAVVAASTAAPGAGWVVIQSGGRRIPGTRSIVSTPSNSESELNPPSPPRFADGPRPTSDLDDADQFEPVLHTVQAGENFWTISRLYYKSTRYYRALHAANASQVPNIKKLYIGTVLKIPPPEKLDRSLIDPETSPVTKTTKRADPNDLTDLAPPVRPRLIRADPEIAETPRRPTYKVKPNDTLRSIARETLGDSRREKEIYNLNRDALDDPKDIPPGTILTLPEDAKLARSVR